MYEKLSDELLFDYFLVHSTRKDDIFCNVPFYISKEEYSKFIDTSEILNNLIFRIVSNINSLFKDFQCFIPDFKYKKEILNLKRPLSNSFWVRYDGFLRASGGIFYSEFNYDKPCAEREILATGDMEAYNNINLEYRCMLKKALKTVLERQPTKDLFRIALLTDPCHYEEAHIMLLMQKELATKNIEFIRVGPSNLYVKDELVYAFHKQVDIILKLFPTEFSSEINDFDNILKVYDSGKVEILNDPRVIACQCKNLYTYLWQLVKFKDSRLSNIEVEVITSTLPYTELFHKDKVDYILKNKNNLVLKPVYGRYSIDVFIGILHTSTEWEEATKYVAKSSKAFIIQDYCEIKESDTYYTPDGKFVFPIKAFANIGCFMLEHDFAGICVRWSDEYLTTDDSTWVTPIGVKNEVINIAKLDLPEKERKKLWDKITEKAMFQANFTGRYVKNFEYIGLDYICLEGIKYKELIEATEKLAKIMNNTQKLLYDNLEHFAPILDISNLVEILKFKYTDEFVFLGRMDWAIDYSGNLKLLELNSETPAGLVESIFIDSIVVEELDEKNLNSEVFSPNRELKSKIVSQFRKIIKDYTLTHTIKTIGILSSTYYEDLYTANAIYKVIKDEPFEFIIGSIYDCKVTASGKLSLFDKELDAVYRYYPLDWFDKEGMSSQKKALENTLSINPTHTIISQSKAFFAVIYELLKQDFYNSDDKDAILKYIPKTSFEVEDINSLDYIVKPVLSREGQGVTLACDLKEMPEGNCIFQERIHTMNLDYYMHTDTDKKRDILYPILGTYITGTEFAGIYTRLGKFVTGFFCIYAPTFIKKERIN